MHLVSMAQLTQLVAHLVVGHVDVFRDLIGTSKGGLLAGHLKARMDTV